MNKLKIIYTFLILFLPLVSFSQLGFCTGSKGEAIFTENFGNGTNYGPALPAGTTNYNFIVGNPNDGSYTLFYRTNLYSTWHYSLDHTPDTTNGTNGKALIVNANANTSGEFYRRVVTGLCVNTTFEFSAWVMNIYNPLSNFCGAGEKPINVRFEIWNDTETILLGSGDTGNLMGTASPIWQQYALVFTTGNETSVVLKMKNNGLGGCGNDLAIDDIEFRACGELTTISSPIVSGDSYQVCSNLSPFSLALQAATAGSSSYFYQWQTSSDGTSWTDVSGANSGSYNFTNILTTTYFRVKAAQDIANLNNSFCSTISNVFTVSFLNSPVEPTNYGDIEICENDPIPTLSVTANATSGVNWYDAATGGNLLQANSTTFTPTSAGTFYAETFDLNTNCLSLNRIPIKLTILPLPTVSISSTTSICYGNSTNVTFNGTPNAEVTYTIDGGSDQFITLNNSGIAMVSTPVLTANSTYTTTNISSPISSSCNQTISSSVTITVNQPPTASIAQSSSVCSGDSSIIEFTGTPNATVYYTINNGTSQFTILNSSGEKEITLLNIVSNTTVTLTEVISAGVNGCSQPLSQSISITVASLPTATISVNTNTLCSGQTVVLTFTGTPNSQINYTQNGSSQSINIDASGSINATTSAINTNTIFQLVSSELTQSPFCFNSLSDSVSVTINPTPIGGFNGDLSYCSGETTAILLTSDLVGTTFSWTVSQSGTTGATSSSGNQINQTLTANNSDGFVTYTVTPSYNGCPGDNFTILVDVYALPNPILTDGAICILNGNTSTQPFVLDTGLTNLNYSYEWYFENELILNATESTFEAFQIGEYAVVVTNNITGCLSSVETAMVTQSVLGESLLIEQSEAFSENPSITVTVVSGEGPFYYQLDNYGYQNSNIFNNVTSGIHTITVIDDSLCTNLTTTITIINYPKFFTPNGDGFNDTWNIIGLEEKSEIFIFDRYGKLLKQINPLGNGWDGTFNGQPSFSTDYWFVVNFLENGISKTFKSHFSLKR